MWFIEHFLIIFSKKVMRINVLKTEKLIERQHGAKIFKDAYERRQGDCFC